jgi:hypothetical protein
MAVAIVGRERWRDKCNTLEVKKLASEYLVARPTVEELGRLDTQNIRTIHNISHASCCLL